MITGGVATLNRRLIAETPAGVLRREIVLGRCRDHLHKPFCSNRRAGLFRPALEVLKVGLGRPFAVVRIALKR
jgi:hypothetical protein